MDRRAQQERQFRKFAWTGDDPRYRKAWGILASVPAGTILDVGCGDGALSEPLANAGWSCLGLELVLDLAHAARRRGLSVALADVAAGFPILDEAGFDAVLAGEIIEHTIDDQKFLNECSRIMKPGGLLILTTPNLVSLGNRFLMAAGKMPRYAYQEFHYRIYNLDTILGKLRAAGFVPLSVQSSHIIISRSSPRRILARVLGGLGEYMAGLFPRLGEMFVIVSEKRVQR